MVLVFVDQGTNTGRVIAMGSFATIFQAEVTAILMTSSLLLFKKVKKRICVSSDNKAAIAKLAKPPPNQLWESTQALET